MATQLNLRPAAKEILQDRAKSRPFTDANEVLCRILDLKTLSIGAEPLLRYSEVLDAFSAHTR